MSFLCRPAAVLCGLAIGCQAIAAAAERPDPFPARYPSPHEQAEAEAALETAVAHLSNGNLEQAAEETLKASRLVPTATAPHVVFGMIAEKRGRAAEAVEAYREALAWNPEESRALAALDRVDAPRYGDIIGQYASQLRDLINQEREARGLHPLKSHPVLAEVAYAHSCAMRDLGFFSHESPAAGQKTSADRFLLRFEGKPRLLGENISRRWRRPQRALCPDNIALSHAELMMSTGHRHNILHPDLVYVGIGIATNPEGDYWITELFMTPRSASVTTAPRGDKSSVTAP
jgi:uncharacterized protein YkwD